MFGIPGEQALRKRSESRNLDSLNGVSQGHLGFHLVYQFDDSTSCILWMLVKVRHHAELIYCTDLSGQSRNLMGSNIEAQNPDDLKQSLNRHAHNRSIGVQLAEYLSVHGELGIVWIADVNQDDIAIEQDHGRFRE